MSITDNKTFDNVLGFVQGRRVGTGNDNVYDELIIEHTFDEFLPLEHEDIDCTQSNQKHWFYEGITFFLEV